MASSRTITITLTEPQFEALRSAVILAETTFQMDGPASVGMNSRVPHSLHTGWQKLTLAWHRARR